VRRSNQLNPMRSMILLAVTWVAGTLLFAAERSPEPSPTTRTAALTQAAAEPVEGGASPTAPEPPPRAGGEADPSEASAEANEGVDEPATNVASEPTDPDEDAKASPDEGSKTSDSTQRARAADTQDTKGTPQRFVPSEQVRADFDVSFPIDI
jgi:hypothetical protein